LIYCEKRPWIDDKDPTNVFWKVARNENGYKFEEFGVDVYLAERDFDKWCYLPKQ
jgi:hypothetical protein